MRSMPPLMALVLAGLVAGCSRTEAPHQGYGCPKVEPPPPLVKQPTEPAQEPAPSRRAQAIEFVRLGYGDELGGEFRSLNFRTEPLNTDITKAAALLLERYNGFEGVKVAQALESLRGDIMYYEFGREASPVLYVHLPYWTHQQEQRCPQMHCREGAWGDKEGSRKLETREHGALLQRVRAAFRAASADTIEPVMADDHVLRIWWD